MKREFELNVQKSEDFLRYFKASMRDPVSGMIEGGGQASFVDGVFETETSARFEYKGRKLFVSWKITQHPNGQLHSIESLTKVADTGEYENVLRELVADIYEKVINGQKTEFFQRTYLTTISGGNLPGEYWIDSFRFAPLFPDDDCTFDNAERIFVVDQSIMAVDINDAREIVRSNAAVISSYLSLILDIGLDSPVHEVKYYLHKEDEYKMVRHSTQLIDTKIPVSMPKKGELCKQVEFENSIFKLTHYAGSAITCPVETRKIFRAIKQSSELVQVGFQAACRMYQLAMIFGKIRPSVGAAYRYGAIDSIVQSNKSEYVSFTTFMGKYSNADKEMCDWIHSKVRSAHWHAGHLPLGEMSYKFESIFDPSHIPTFALTRESNKLMRLAILNWLNEQIDFSNC